MVGNFLSRVEAFIARYGISPSAFGLATINDSGFVFDLRAGRRSPRLNTCQRVDAWMQEEAARRRDKRRRRRAPDAGA